MDNWLNLLTFIIPTFISICALRSSRKNAEKNRLLTQQIHQPEFKIVRPADGRFQTSKLLLFALENLGNNLFTIKEVTWESSIPLEIVCYKDIHTKSRNKEEYYRKDVIYIQMKAIHNFSYAEGKIKINYTDVHGNNQTVWSPKIKINKEGIENRKMLWYQFFTKYN